MYFSSERIPFSPFQYEFSRAVSLQAAPSVINLSGQIWFLFSIFQFCIILQFNSKMFSHFAKEKDIYLPGKKSVIAVLQSLV